MTSRTRRMYHDAETYNPFKGCEFNCTYCRPSFQRQARRQRSRCRPCYDYRPHEHPERLDVRRIRKAKTVFICGNGDIAFCSVEYARRVLEVVAEHSRRHPETEYYLQSKRPDCFKPLLRFLPPSALLVTTLETNRDAGYEKVSEAPRPTARYEQFCELDWPRKVVTMEPVMDFDVEPFATMVASLRPEHVWLGFNSRPNEVALPEPSREKMEALVELLRAKGLVVRAKDLRGIEVPVPNTKPAKCPKCGSSDLAPTLLGRANSASSERYTHVDTAAVRSLVEARWERLAKRQGQRAPRPRLVIR